MKILFISAVFPPEREPAAVMAGELAAGLSCHGHRVTVICPFPNRPAGRIYSGYARQLRKVTVEKQVRIVRVPNWLLGEKRRLPDRLLENLSFGLMSGAALLREEKPDVLLLETWPLFAFVPPLLWSRWRNVPVVNYIQDVWPEALSTAGLVPPESFLHHLLTRLDRYICLTGARNVVISHGMKEMLMSRRGLSSDRFVVIPNWLNLDHIRPREDASAWRIRMGISKKRFICMFAGTMGYTSGIDILVSVAEILRDCENLLLVCVGEGVLKTRIEEGIRNRKLKNLWLLPFQPAETVPEMQSAADVMLLTTSPNMGCASVPSKLITYLAVGKPVICSVDPYSDIAGLVKTRCIGWVVSPGDPRSLAQAVRQAMGKKPEERLEMGKRSRRAVLEGFSLDAAINRFNPLFQEIRAR